MRNSIKRYSELIIIETEDNKLRLERRHPETLAIVAFAYFATKGMIDSGSPQWLPLAHAIVFVYVGAAAVMNKMIIKIGHGVLTRKLAPLPFPWPRRFVIHYKEISSVICVHSIRRRKANYDYYSINVLLADRRSITVLTSIYEKDVAEMIAKKIAGKVGRLQWDYTENNGVMQTRI